MRMTMLDNSIFELGEACDPDKFRRWINAMEPTYSIIPDALDSADQTVRNFDDWFKHPRRPKNTRYMAVAQGETHDDLRRTFELFQADPRVDLVGVSFDSKPFTLGAHAFNIDQTMLEGRRNFINSMTSFGKKRLRKPIHLLGCALPQELKAYRSYERGVIFSVDTSSPVVHGYHNIRYTGAGLTEKIKTKLDSLIDVPVTKLQFESIKHNMQMFRSFTS